MIKNTIRRSAAASGRESSRIDIKASVWRQNQKGSDSMHSKKLLLDRNKRITNEMQKKNYESLEYLVFFLRSISFDIKFC